jgi:hypothetical protein
VSLRAGVLIKLLAGLCAAYVGLCLLVALLQRGLMYFPDRSSEADALRRAGASGLAAWRDEAGQLVGWRRPRPRGGATRVLLFHGNAGSALDRVAYLPVLETPDRDVILMEYPGYGMRSGEPSESALVADAIRALGRLKSEGQVLLVGESLGSGVAAQAAAADPEAVKGLLLITPFARMSDVAATHYPYLPVRLILRDRFDSVTALAKYHGPVAVLVAGQDEVVGAAQGRRLAQACAGTAKVWEQPEAGHNTLDLTPGVGVWPEMLAFVMR